MVDIVLFKYSHGRRLQIFIVDLTVELKDLVQRAFRLRHCLLQDL